MFTIKLGTGKTFEATAVNESYRASQGDFGSRYQLSIEDSNAKHGIQEYTDILQEDGALDTVEVLRGDETILTLAGYTNVNDVSLRLLSTGARQLSITLEKPRQ